MGKSTKDKQTRRKFLSLGFLGDTNEEGNSPEALAPTDSGEKVKMLTADGQLVEVDKNILRQAAKRQQAKNEDILNWTKSVK